MHLQRFEVTHEMLLMGFIQSIAGALYQKLCTLQDQLPKGGVTAEDWTGPNDGACETSALVTVDLVDAGMALESKQKATAWARIVTSMHCS